MKLQIIKHRRAFLFAQIALIFTWMTNLLETDSFYSVYIICALLGVAALCDNYVTVLEISHRVKRAACIISAMFATATILANYMLFQPFGALLNVLNALLSFLGGFIICFHILVCIAVRLPINLREQKRMRPVIFYWCCFVSIAAIFLLYLFFVAYPGYLSTDSITSLNQIESGEYVNNNPFWYTMLIRTCMQVGYALFGEKNAAVAVYSTVQILIMAASFAYALVTLYQAHMPKWCIAVSFVLYTFLPYNLTYSVTMWKDVLFSISALLFATSLYRILKNIGVSKVLNYLTFALAGIGFCLMRTNGWYAYLITAIIVFAAMCKKNKRLPCIMCAVLAICWVLINPIQNFLGVEKTDFVETLAVPFQQIARVVSHDCEISDEDMALLSDIFYIDRVKEEYSPEIVDPIKFDAFRSEQRGFLKENIGKYFKLWVRLGLQYPVEYLEAWVELTKGFWNGGYYFWIYIRWSYPEISGVGGFEMDNPVKDAFDAVFRYLEKPVYFEALYSIGLHVWIVIACCFTCAVNKREEFIITIPFLVLIAGLWVGTPVYAEFRYAYPIFVSFPVILLTSVFAKKTSSAIGKE